MLRVDCEKQGEAHLRDFAPGVYARVDQALTALEASHATTDQQGQLLALSRQMLGLEDDAFKFCLDNMPIEVLNALLSVTRGLESGGAIYQRQGMGNDCRGLSRYWRRAADEEYGGAMPRKPSRFDGRATLAG